MRFTIMSGLLGVFCSVLILSALELTPSECSPQRQTRDMPDLTQGLDAFKQMTTSITESEMFVKFLDLAKEFMKKIQEFFEQFMKSRRRREVSFNTPLEIVNLHRQTRDMPDLTQGLDAFKQMTTSITESEMFVKFLDLAKEFMKKIQEFFEQFMKSRRRREVSFNTSLEIGNLHRQTRDMPDLTQGLDAFKQMATSITESEIFIKFLDLAKEFMKKIQEFFEQFMKSRRRREVLADIHSEIVNLHRQTRYIPILNEGLHVFKQVTKSITDSEMFLKFLELVKEFMRKIQEFFEQFLKSRKRREVSSETPLELANSHRVVRQIPGIDQAISAMKNTGESFVKIGADLMSKFPEAAADAMKKAQELGSQFMKPSGRRRRSSRKSKTNQRKNHRD